MNGPWFPLISFTNRVGFFDLVYRLKQRDDWTFLYHIFHGFSLDTNIFIVAKVIE
jgi:hypothetical protein